MVCDMGREYSPVGIGRKLNYILPGLQVKIEAKFPQVKGRGSDGAAEHGRAFPLLSTPLPAVITGQHSLSFYG